LGSSGAELIKNIGQCIFKHGPKKVDVKTIECKTEYIRKVVNAVIGKYGEFNINQSNHYVSEGKSTNSENNTNKFREILNLARQGLTQSDIAVKLNITQGTVSKVINRYRQQLQQKRSEQ
jgi:DNA-binding NarL/FixJ family response regulator